MQTPEKRYSSHKSHKERRITDRCQTSTHIRYHKDKEYHDMAFSVENLCTLAAKTTCKDRWRQILNEADRLRDENKYLCTMQQGISSAQMDEMQAENVVLVVPEPYIVSYPKDRRDRIWTIGQFVDYVKKMEGLI